MNRHSDGHMRIFPPAIRAVTAQRAVPTTFGSGAKMRDLGGKGGLLSSLRRNAFVVPSGRVKFGGNANQTLRVWRLSGCASGTSIERPKKC